MQQGRFGKRAVTELAFVRLTVTRMCLRSTTTAIDYGFDRKATSVGGKNALIFNLGGTSLEVSLSKIEVGIVDMMSSARDLTLEARPSTTGWCRTSYKTSRRNTRWM